MLKAFITALLAFLIPISFAKPVEIKNGFGSGEDYLNMSSSEQRAYASGVINGILLAPFFGAPKQKMLRVERCVVGMTDSQVAAILSTYLKNNPSLWHVTPHAPMYAALMETCPQ